MSNPASLADQPPVTARRVPSRLLWISLALIFVGSLGAYLVKTDFGRVDVTGFTLPTQGGQWVTADLFRPLSATDKNPVPIVVVCPGFERSKETLDSYAIELARRGFAVITIDPYAQGASSASRQRRSASLEGYGVVPMVEYIFSTPNLNYVDKSRIGAAGYSAGGNAVLQSASLFGGRAPRAARRATVKDSSGTSATATATPAVAATKPKAKKKKTKSASTTDAAKGTALAKAASSVRAADSSDAPKPKPPSKLAAVFVGGYVLTMTDSVLGPIRSNVAMDYALHDEGAFRNVNKNADMRTAPEALRLINSGLPKDSAVSVVEIDRVYGDPTARTMRVVHNTNNIHPLLPYDTRSVAHMVDFFTDVFGVKTPLAASQQLWWLKELFTLMALVGGMLFLVPFASLLLRTPAFAALAKPVPPALPKPGRTGTVIYWTTFAVSALLACFLFIPMVLATFKVFPAASAAQQTWWFPQRINNAVLLWALANGTIGLLLFFATYRFFGRRNGVTPEMLGLRVSARELGRTALLALLVAGGFFVLLFTAYGIFHTDFRFLFVSAPASFPRRMLLVALMYLPLFFVFYLANSVRVNAGGRFAHQPAWRSLLINGLGNSVGLVLILGIQYASFVSTGTVYWTAEWLFANLLFGIIPMMFLLPFYNRWFFQLTGRVWLGPMVTCLVFVMMMLTSNVCYIPLR
ncbi:MAG: alpha/beta hydrolase [Gemmatimonadota bacterium]|nr:alpha/beta hydrolase [Gemmatimonadota bacterium]